MPHASAQPVLLNRCVAVPDRVHLRLADEPLPAGSKSKSKNVPLKGTLVIATAGLNRAKNVMLPAEVLKANKDKFEGAKMFLNHGNSFAVFDREFQDEVGILRNVRFDDKADQLKADFTIFDAELADNLRTRAEAGELESARVSLSLVGVMDVVKQDVPAGESDFVRVLESIEFVESVDFVAFDAANGFLEKLEQALTPPILVRESISAPSGGDVIPPKEDTFTMDEAKIKELQDRVTDLDSKLQQSLGDNENLRKSNSELQSSLVRMHAEKLIAESGLPEPCVAPIRSLIEAEGITVDVIRQAISAKKEELTGLEKAGLLRQSAKVEDVNGTDGGSYYPAVTDTEKKETTDRKSASDILRQTMVDSFRRKGISEDEAKAMAEKAVI